MRKFFTAGAGIASVIVTGLGQAVWVISDQGSATGFQIFQWLWLPPVVFIVALLLGRTTPKSLRLVHSIAASVQLALTALMLGYDWSQIPFIIQAGEAHTGELITRLTSLQLQPTLILAVASQAISSALLALGAIIRPKVVQSSQPKEAGFVENDAGKNLNTAHTDPRTIWDSQSD